MYINRYYINLTYKIYTGKYNYRKIRLLYSFIFYASCIKSQIIRLLFFEQSIRTRYYCYLILFYICLICSFPQNLVHKILIQSQQDKSCIGPLSLGKHHSKHVETCPLSTGLVFTHVQETIRTKFNQGSQILFQLHYSQMKPSSSLIPFSLYLSIFNSLFSMFRM